MLYNEKTSPYFADRGKFRILFHMPGELLPNHGDHGYGALATVAESYMDHCLHGITTNGERYLGRRDQAKVFTSETISKCTISG